MLLFRELVEEVIQRLLLGRHASGLWRRVAAVLASPDCVSGIIGVNFVSCLHATVRPVAKPFGFGNVVQKTFHATPLPLSLLTQPILLHSRSSTAEPLSRLLEV